MNYAGHSATCTSPAPDISVVIVSYTTRELTLHCLRSMYTQTRDVTFQVFVVDNASADGSAAAIAAAFPQARLIGNAAAAASGKDRHTADHSPSVVRRAPLSTSGEHTLSPVASVSSVNAYGALTPHSQRPCPRVGHEWTRSVDERTRGPTPITTAT